MVFAYSTSMNCISMTVSFPALNPVKSALSQTSALVVGGLMGIWCCAFPVWPFDRMALKSERCLVTKGTMQSYNRSWIRKHWGMGSWLLTCSAKQAHWYAGDFSLCDFQGLSWHQTDISKRLRTEENIWYPFKARTSDLMKAVSEWDMIQISNYICLAQHSLINHSNI